MFSIDLDRYRIVDLSLAVVPPGSADRPFVVERGRLADNAFKFEILRTHTHVGTHVESPAHFFEDGEDCAALPLERFFGRAVLLDITDALGAQEMEGEFLEKHLGERLAKGDIVVCRNSDKASTLTPCFAPGGAIWLRERGVKLVGVGPDIRLGSTVTATRGFHDILMRAGVCLVEFLSNLEALHRDEFFFMALPVRWAGVDSAPARAIAIEER